jgi:hypothetical protein
MKKATLLLAVMFACLSTFAQQPNTAPVRKADKRSFIDAPVQTPSIVSTQYKAQRKAPVAANPKATAAITATQIGSSTNILTVYQPENNCVAADNGFGRIVFIHRNNTALFPLTSSQYRYDISTDKGNTWTVNIGPLNPTADGQVGGINGRYPQTVFHNPTGNTIPDSVYGIYQGTYHNGASTTDTWDGTISGVYRLDGNSATWTETNTLQNSGNVNITASLSNGLPGEFWAIDWEFANLADSVLLVYKGVWNASTHDVTWTIAHRLNPGLNLYVDTTYQINPLIAFDATGQTGWIACAADIAPSTNTVYEPFFYKSTDGGATWTGPIRYDMPNDVGIMATLDASGTGIPTVAFENDLVVDMHGDPHYINVVGSGSAHSIQSGLTKTLFDFTYVSATNTWEAMRIDSTQTFRGTLCTDATTGGNYITDNRPQLSMSPARDKIFYFWSDSDPVAWGGDNTQPDLFGKGYDVNTGIWSPTINFSLNDPVWGTFGARACAWPCAAPTSFRNAANDASLAPIVVTGINSSGFGTDPPDHYYFNNIQFDDAMFVGVQENEALQNNIRVFPNPAKDEFTLSLTGLQNENAIVTLTDILGKTVRHFGNTFTGFARYNVRGLDAGIYFVTVTTSKGVATHRLEIIK